MDVVDGGDVGMIQTRRGARFTHDARADLARRRVARRQALQGDAPLEPRIVAEIHLAHAAGPKLADDLVRADRPAEQYSP